MAAPVLLYDADCGFCTATARRLPLLRLGVEVRALQECDLAALGVDEARARVEMPFVDGTGVHYGHRAYAAALQHGHQPLRLLGRVLGSRLLDGPAGAAYHWVATNRHRLPGGTAACALDRRP